jgi:hypothetical protein
LKFFFKKRPHDAFSTEIHVNTGTQLLAAYGFTVNFDAGVISVDTSNGTDGVDPGPDGFLAAVNPTEPGILKITGFDVTGTGPGEDLYVLDIYWTAGSADGSTILELIIDNLVDENSNVIGSPASENGSVRVTDVVLGDVNEDTKIDIIDALLVAQYYVGMDPDNFDPEASDVDASGEIDIIDALLIAQKYVGIIDTFPGE